MRHVSPIESLVAAVLKENGDGLVMHVGERPYVLSPNGSTNLSERTLTVDAMKGVLNDLLSPADQETLDDIGAVEREIASKDAPGTPSCSSPRGAATTSGSNCAASGRS
jgi:hypothetical protein